MRVTVVAAALALGTAWTVWAALGQSGQPISYQLHSFDVRSPSDIAIKVEVHREDPSQAAECNIFAQSEDHAIVGEKVLQIAPSTDATVYVTTGLVTERKAVAGVLRDCAMSAP